MTGMLNESHSELNELRTSHSRAVDELMRYTVNGGADSEKLASLISHAEATWMQFSLAMWKAVHAARRPDDFVTAHSAKTIRGELTQP